MTLPWWKRLPSRLLDDDASVAHLYRGGENAKVTLHRWLQVDGEPRLRVVLDVIGRAEEIEVSFPPHYPDGCPSVRPIPNRTVSGHQYHRSGILCLELGPDNWHANHSAADIVASAWRLFAFEAIDAIAPIEIPSRHSSDLAERVMLAEGVLLRSPVFDERLAEAGTPTDFEFVWRLRHVRRVVPTKFPTGSALPDVPPAFRHLTGHTGAFVPLHADAPDEVPVDLAAFQAFVEEHGGLSLQDGRTLVMLKWTSGKTVGFLQVEDALRLVDVPLTTADEGRAPAELGVLSALNVCIVGLGSLGSKVAVSLARAGVSSFVFIDGDLLLAPNVPRHAASYFDVGAFKVDAARELIRDVSPSEPTIVRHAANLLSAINPESHAKIVERCASADLLVDATANPEVFGMLAQISSDFRRPLVWGEVFGGGLGGLIGSAHPDRTPCARCVRAGFLAESNAWPPAPARDVPNAYETDDPTPLISADPHVSLIAAAMTMRICDLVSSDEAVPEVTLFGFRRRWIFDSPHQTVHVRVRSDDFACPRCWVPDGAPDVACAAQAEALFDAPDDAPAETPQ